MPTVTVSDDALDEFRDAVFRKHGRLYGVLKSEADAALRAAATRMNGGDAK